MMKLILLLLGILFELFNGAVGSSEARSLTACGVHCWENTQYVSHCNGDLKCLCTDGEFQAALFQCMHSQCATPQFAASLHETLARCSEYGQEQIKAYAQRRPRSNHYHYGNPPRDSEMSSPGYEKPTRSVQRRHYVTRSAPTHYHVTRASVEPTSVTHEPTLITPAPTASTTEGADRLLWTWVQAQMSNGHYWDHAWVNPPPRPTRLIARGSVHAGNGYGRPRPTGY